MDANHGAALLAAINALVEFVEQLPTRHDVEMERVRPLLAKHPSLSELPQRPSGYYETLVLGESQLFEFEAFDGKVSALATITGLLPPQSPKSELRPNYVARGYTALPVHVPTGDLDDGQWFARMRSYRQAAWALPNMSQTLIEPPKRNSVEDGPFGKDGFAWQGKRHRGLSPRAFRLVGALWRAADRTLAFGTAVQAVHGEDIGPDDPLNGARKDANAFFRNDGILLCISVSGPFKADRVTLAPPLSKKTRSKRAKKTSNRP